MPQIQVTDEIFEAARRRAASEGYFSVEEYVAEVLGHDLSEAGLQSMIEKSNTVEPAVVAKPIWQKIADAMADMPADELRRVPRDGAENHDRYIYRERSRPE